MVGGVAARFGLLTKGAVHAMLLEKLKFVAAIIVSLCLAGTGSGVLAYRSLRNETDGMTLDAVNPQNQGGERSEKAAIFQGKLQDDDPVADDVKPGADKAKEKRKDKEKKDSRQKAEEVLSQSFKTGQA